MKPNGKEICEQLKAIRREVADRNGIALEQHPCSHPGPCNGTCPRCEAEVQYLEHELDLRRTLGKAAAVAGVALSLASMTSCTATEGDIDERYIYRDTIAPQADTATQQPTAWFE